MKKLQAISIALVALSPAFALAQGKPPKAPPAAKPPGKADSADAKKKEASALYKDGKDAYDKGDYDTALAKFRASHDAQPSPNSRLMISRTLAKQGKDDEALREARAAADEAHESIGKDAKYVQTEIDAQNDATELQKKIAAAKAAPPPPPPPPPAQNLEIPPPDAKPDGADKADKEEEGKNDRGAFVVGGKIGALASIDGLKPHVTGAVQVGYIFPWFRRQLALLVDVGYAQPVTSKTESDPRVAGGSYNWHLIEQQLTIQPSVYYRLSILPDVGPGKFVPYAGVGPRIFLTRSKTDSDGTTPTLLRQNEQSTLVGVGANLGTEYLIGPGGILVEALFGWAKIKEQTTGDAHLSAISAWAGYRFML